MNAPTESRDLVRRLRRESGLSQRALASGAGTSGPTVAAYEAGDKEPRLSTLMRLAESVDFTLDVRLVASDIGERQRARRSRRDLALAAATATAIRRDFDAASRLASKNLRLMRAVVGPNSAVRWIDEWRARLDEGTSAVVEQLLELGDHGDDMRSMTPFAGLLTVDERAMAVAVADALIDRAGVR